MRVGSDAAHEFEESQSSDARENAARLFEFTLLCGPAWWNLHNHCERQEELWWVLEESRMIQLSQLMRTLTLLSVCRLVYDVCRRNQIDVVSDDLCACDAYADAFIFVSIPGDPDPLQLGIATVALRCFDDPIRRVLSFGLICFSFVCHGMSFLLISASHLADGWGKSRSALSLHAPPGPSVQRGVVRAAHCGERDYLLPMNKRHMEGRELQRDGLNDRRRNLIK